MLGRVLILVAGGDSNPRPLGYEPNELPLLHPAAGAGSERVCVLAVWSPGPLAGGGQRVGGVRGGLASRGVAPTVLSGAALGHDRVRDGTGWGQHALGHGHPPPPARSRETESPGIRHRRERARSWRVAHAPCTAP